MNHIYCISRYCDLSVRNQLPNTELISLVARNCNKR